MDRRAWVNWLYQARRRYGLSVLIYVVTSNHIYLLVKDMGRGEIARSMQLISGRVAQQFNRRKSRKGAYKVQSKQLNLWLSYLNLRFFKLWARSDPTNP